MFSNVNIDWGLVSDEHSYDDVDYSDDDLDKVQVRTGDLDLGLGLWICSISASLKIWPSMDMLWYFQPVFIFKIA